MMPFGKRWIRISTGFNTVLFPDICLKKIKAIEKNHKLEYLFHLFKIL